MESSLNYIDLYVIPWTIKLVMALAIFYIGKIVAQMLTRLITKTLQKSKMDEMLVKFFSTIAYVVLIIAVILAAIDGLGVNITSLLAVVAAAGLAVGLALKDSLANFAAGVMLVIFRPFKIGDFITAGGTSGVVDEIGLFHTIMHTPDNQRIIVPNSAIINDNITNVSALPTRRIDMVFSISYGDDIGTAKEIIRRVLSEEDRLLSDPPPMVVVAELADSSVNINVRPWVNTTDFWPTRWDLLERIKVELEKGGITIPFPQRDVHMHSAQLNSAQPSEKTLQ